MLNKSIFYLCVIIAGFILTGCSAPGPKFSGLQAVTPSTSELIIYRKSAVFASAQTMPVLIDGTRTGELYNGSFMQQEVAPGNHTIKVTTGMLGKSAEATVQLAAGQRKFMLFDYPTGVLANPFFVGITLTEHSEAEALIDLKELSSAKKVVADK